METPTAGPAGQRALGWGHGRVPKRKATLAAGQGDNPHLRLISLPRRCPACRPLLAGVMMEVQAWEENRVGGTLTESGGSTVVNEGGGAQTVPGSRSMTGRGRTSIAGVPDLHAADHPGARPYGRLRTRRDLWASIFSSRRGTRTMIHLPGGITITLPGTPYSGPVPALAGWATGGVVGLVDPGSGWSRCRATDRQGNLQPHDP